MNTLYDFKWGTLILSGIISILVGIATGYGVNWLSEKNAELSYDITAIQAFPGQERIGIAAIRILNSGKKEIENIDATFRFQDAEVKEVIFQGLKPQIINKNKNSVQIHIPFLNPTENFSVQILVAPNSQTLQKPIVDLRAKGAIGIPFTKDKTDKQGLDLLSLGAAALGALFALTFVSKFRNNKITDGHSGDQRDIFAFVLGYCGLNQEADLVRSWSRELSYWSISDLLTEKWLAKGDLELIRLGKSSFEKLIEYANIAPQSKRILKINTARLSISLNDLVSAKKLLVDATTVNDKVASRRIALSPTLSNLSTP